MSSYGFIADWYQVTRIGTLSERRLLARDAFPTLVIPQRPRLTIACLLASDVFGLLLAMGLSCGLQALALAAPDAGLLAPAAAILIFILGSFAIYHLYDPVALCPAEELRRSSLLITFVYAAVGAGTYFVEAKSQSKLVFAGGWLLSLFMVPIGR